jgi:hypothetical protein
MPLPDLNADHLSDRLKQLAGSAAPWHIDLSEVVVRGKRARRYRQAAYTMVSLAGAACLIASVGLVNADTRSTLVDPTRVAALAQPSEGAPLSSVAPVLVVRDTELYPTFAPPPIGAPADWRTTPCLPPIVAGATIGDWHVWFTTAASQRIAVVGPDNREPCSARATATDPTTSAPGFWSTQAASRNLGEIALPGPVLAYGRAPEGTTSVLLADVDGRSWAAVTLASRDAGYGVPFVVASGATIASVTAYDADGRATLLPRSQVRLGASTPH